MQWFRLYSEVKDDPKMLALDDHTFRIWIYLLVMASSSKERGVIPKLPLRGLAAALHTTEKALSDALALFQQSEFSLIQVLDDGAIRINKFLDRQYDYPSDMPEAARERKKKQRDASRESHDPVTNCHETDSDTDSDLDINIKDSPASAGAEAECVAPAEKSEEDGAQQLCGRAKTATVENTAPTVGSNAGKGDYTSDFERFWSAYPLKKEKKAAYKNWRARIREKVSPEALIAAAERYAGECRKHGTEPRFIKHGATFLGPNKPYEEYLQKPVNVEQSRSAADMLAFIEGMV